MRVAGTGSNYNLLCSRLLLIYTLMWKNAELNSINVTTVRQGGGGAFRWEKLPLCRTSYRRYVLLKFPHILDDIPVLTLFHEKNLPKTE